MRIVTVTSDTFVASTALMLESLRIWHADVPVTVYTLSEGWSDAHAERLAPYRVTLRRVEEAGDTSDRGGAMGGGVQNRYKLDIFLEQQEPYLFLDSDILVLRPLDEVFEAILRDGWFTVHEGTSLEVCNRGEVAALTQLEGDLTKIRTLNSGVLGCVPQTCRDIFTTARDWGQRIEKNYHGDQGLINLAWYRLRGRIPPDAGTVYNGGWRSDDRIVLTQSILHFARPNYPGPGRSKLDDQSRVWAAWPRGVRLVRLSETQVWQQSLPHPWPWLNQANRRAHRAFVRRFRQASLALEGIDWLVIDSPEQAFLLHPRVLRRLDEAWARHADRFARLRYVPTYHLLDAGQVRSPWTNRLRWWRDEIQSFLR